MKTTGLSITDTLATITRYGTGVGAHVEKLDPLAAELGVMVTELDLYHHGEEVNYRPYVHLSGEVASVRPVGEKGFGHDIEGVVFAPGRGDTVDVYYEFTDDQMNQMVSQGYFTPGFGLPAELVGTEWALPATVSGLVVVPDDHQMHPVVLVSIEEAGNLSVDEQNSGYDLAAFARVLEGPTQAPTAPQDEAGEPDPQRRDDEIDSLFTPEEILEGLGEHRSAEPVEEVPVVDETSVLDEIDAGLDTIASDLEAEQAAARQRAEQDADTVGTLYRTRVNPDAQESERPRTTVPAPAPVTGDDDLDLDLDLEDSGRDEDGPELG